MVRTAIATIAMVLLLSGAAPAEDKSTAVDPHLAAALDLVDAIDIKADVTRTINSMLPLVEKVLRQTHPNVSDSVVSEFEAAFRSNMEANADLLKSEFASDYAAHFSESELRELARFCRSELGRKFNREMPAIAKQAADQRGAWARGVSIIAMKAAMDQLQKEGKPL